MKNIFKTMALGLFLALTASTASHAQSARTWVSSTGFDGNACSRSAPCLTFAGALAKTTAGGEIDVIDSGDYGQLPSITKAVTIDGTGTQASIVTSANTPAITINAGTGNTVILRHLALTGVSGSGIGVSLNTGNMVVEDCKISGFNTGIGDGLLLSSSGNSVITNTSVTGCSLGVRATGAGLVSLRNDTMQGNGNGFNAEGGPVDISHSLIAQNMQVGLAALQGTLSVSGCTISGNNIGVYTVSGAIIRLTNNDIFNNATGIDTVSSGGTVSTTGNNRKAGNATPGAPTPGKVIVTQ